MIQYLELVLKRDFASGWKHTVEKVGLLLKKHPKWVQKRRLKSWIGEKGLERIGIIKPRRLNLVIPNSNYFSSISNERCVSCHVMESSLLLILRLFS